MIGKRQSYVDAIWRETTRTLATGTYVPDVALSAVAAAVDAFWGNGTRTLADWNPTLSRALADLTLAAAYDGAGEFRYRKTVNGVVDEAWTTVATANAMSATLDDMARNNVTVEMSAMDDGLTLLAQGSAVWVICGRTPLIRRKRRRERQAMRMAGVM